MSPGFVVHVLIQPAKIICDRCIVAGSELRRRVIWHCTSQWMEPSEWLDINNALRRSIKEPIRVSGMYNVSLVIGLYPIRLLTLNNELIIIYRWTQWQYVFRLGKLTMLTVLHSRCLYTSRLRNQQPTGCLTTQSSGNFFFLIKSYQQIIFFWKKGGTKKKTHKQMKLITLFRPRKKRNYQQWTGNCCCHVSEVE